MQRASELLGHVARQQRTLNTERRRKRHVNTTKVVLRTIRHVAEGTTPVVPTFTAADMRTDWQQYWCPTDDCDNMYANAWERIAQEVGMHRAERAPWVPVDDVEFGRAAKLASGAAGWDGWTSHEVLATAKHMPWMITDLLALLNDTARLLQEDPGIPEVLRIRVVGIPKRVPTESRPLTSPVSGPASLPAPYCGLVSCRNPPTLSIVSPELYRQLLIGLQSNQLQVRS